jgi:hypothetical protein
MRAGWLSKPPTLILKDGEGVCNSESCYSSSSEDLRGGSCSDEPLFMQVDYQAFGQTSSLVDSL